MDSVSSSDGYDNDGEQRNQSSVPLPDNSNGTDHSVRHEADASASVSVAAGVRGRGSSNFIGKHRLAAAITQLQLQIQFIQEELEQLETLGESSLVCKELISSVESRADALLPTIKGGVGDSGWDRWFQGTHHHHHSSKHRKRWI